MPEQTKYFTFPVHLLKGAFYDITNVTNDIMDYAGYAHTLKLDLGTNIEKIKATGQYFGLTWGNENKVMANGKKLYENTPAKSPMTSLNKDIIFDYYKNKKDEFDIACFLGFAAVRSILQVKLYCKTNKAFIHARMFGYSSVSTMKNDWESKNDLNLKYGKRWHMDKMLKDLQLSWGLKLLSDHSRGFYISFDLNHEKLALILLQEKKKTKEKELQKSKKEALNKAKQQLNNSLTP